MIRFIIRVLVPLLIVAVALVGARKIATMKKAPPRGAAGPAVETVAVLRARPERVRVKVRATGTVSAAREITLTPQVSGRLVAVSERLVPGGRFETGEEIARIDDRDHRLAVRQAESQVKAALLELEQEQSRRGVAEREWKMLKLESTARERRLALREPQMEAARAKLDAAEAALEKVKLDLERTVLSAPFPCAVVEEGGDIGQLVGSQSALARLVGTERVWVIAAVPVERLADLAGIGSSGAASVPARVFQDAGRGEAVTHQAIAVRLLAELETRTRRARVLLEVRDPFDPPGGGLPLLPGAFVNVELDGRMLEDVIRIPLAALHHPGLVWTVKDGKLARRAVEIGWRQGEEVFVTGGLEAGATVVTSVLKLPVEGAPVELESATGERK